MMKLTEGHTQGGNLLILHVDDRHDLSKFYNHPLAEKTSFGDRRQVKILLTKYNTRYSLRESKQPTI
jgi:hypothetical protein